MESQGIPIVKDLIVGHTAFDRVIQAGGYISVNTSGNTIDANAVPIQKEDADDAFSAAIIDAEHVWCHCKTLLQCCIVCLSKSFSISNYYLKVIERRRDKLNMVNQMDSEGFGNCGTSFWCV